MLTIELICYSSKYISTTVYHPPTPFPAKNIEFIDTFTSLMNELLDFRIPIIMAGDTNINLLNPNRYGYVDIYVKNLFELGLKPLVTLPTKVNVENLITRFSIIDHMWASNGLQNDYTFIFPLDITDHFPIISFISLNSVTLPKAILSKRRRFANRGKEIFRILLSNIHVNTTQGDLNASYNDYYSKVYDGYFYNWFFLVNNQDG